LKLISNFSHSLLTHIPSTTHLSPDKFPSPIAKYLTNPTHPHSHIFQKVLANAFLLFTRSAAKY
ncbi:TPA: hypothetical protein ACPTY8_005051, partial [Klebsiella pneumoniae]